jgi:4-hydroxy-L-threonine phosphate dehydrogenase PdxA
MTIPIIAITMGDAAGIGPEVTAKSLQGADLYRRCRPFVVADPAVMSVAVTLAGLPMAVREVASPEEAEFRPGLLDVVRPPELERLTVAHGHLSAAAGRGAALCIREAFRLAAAGRVQGVVSAPMNKEAFHLAGYDYPDEMAYMTDLTASPDTYTLGVMGRVWTTRLAEHVPFRAIADLITRDSVLRHTRQLHAALRKVGQGAPRIAVAALNVHGGEGGLFGREEIEQIAPGVAAARAEGIDASGPLPADSVFARALAGEFDGVVGMYHDQVNIPSKLQPMGERATVFMGLPVPCGTTAHGSAFDIAGRGIADPSGLHAALDCTIRLSS